MKYIFSLLLFLVIFGCILTSKSPKKKPAMNSLNEFKKNITLEEQITTIESSIIEEFNWEDFINGTIDYEVANASGLFDDPVIFHPEAPVITKPKNINYTLAPIQFKKFHNFRIFKERDIIQYKIFLYFLNILVAQNIIFMVISVFYKMMLNYSIF